MRRMLAQVLVFVTAVGCVPISVTLIPTPPTTPTTEAYEKVLDTWVGVDSDRLLRAWGSPESSFPMSGGHTLWTYVRTSSYQTPQNSYSTTIYQPPHPWETSGSLHTTTTTVGGGTINFRCQTDFEVGGSNKIVRWRWSGNSCRVVPEPGPIDCTGLTYTGRVGEYHSEGDTVAVSLYHPRQQWEDLTLIIGGKHLEYLNTHCEARQWVEVCGSSGRGSYLVLYPQEKFILIDELTSK